MRRGALAALAALVAVSIAPAALHAQPAVRRPAWELRADAIVAESERVAHAGAGFTTPLGTYARAVFAAGAGAAFHHGEAHASGRAEALVRVTTDPFAEAARALNLAGGVSLRAHEGGGRRRLDLVLLVGLDGRPRGGWAPGLELGLGGGVRAGVALRQVRGGRR